MNCPHCGAQWQLPENNSRTFDKCPFCQGDMNANNQSMLTIANDTIDFEYEYCDLGNGTVELTFCKSPLQQVMKFPKIIEGKQVVSIAGSIFGTSKGSARDSVKTIYIPEGVTKIGDRAFYGCKSLRAIIFPEGVTSLGEYALKNCKALDDVILPLSLTNIGKGAFAGSGITNIALPQKIKSIPSECFKNCTRLTNVSLSNSLSCIKDEAFSGCKCLNNIVLPNSVTYIMDNAFCDCDSLTSIIISNAIASMGECVFSGCTTLTIYCETEVQPNNWDSLWNALNGFWSDGGEVPVVWGYKGN